MPQMSPMWWLTLMLVFNLFYLIMNSLLYFNYDKKFHLKTSTKKLKMNWLW
uniref:ATP synthase complex subunit 8 n=1 Tax=Idioscopus nitidulus TaxID=1561089 RepID=A0A0U2F0K4_9HEMI|nr:ATP synthase F0 subunit 8 [Idioscopus nitidulus]AKU47320.1 ATP synthetase F0 subunit 8 [Idioscopus nitidulus]